MLHPDQTSQRRPWTYRERNCSWRRGPHWNQEEEAHILPYPDCFRPQAEEACRHPKEEKLLMGEGQGACFPGQRKDPDLDQGASARLIRHKGLS